jgi:hypothetical protein
VTLVTDSISVFGQSKAMPQHLSLLLSLLPAPQGCNCFSRKHAPNNDFCSPVRVFVFDNPNMTTSPVSPRPAGYTLLQQRHGLNCLPHHVESVVVSQGTRRTHSTPHKTEEIYPKSYWPRESDLADPSGRNGVKTMQEP